MIPGTDRTGSSDPYPKISEPDLGIYTLATMSTSAAYSPASERYLVLRKGLGDATRPSARKRIRAQDEGGK